MTQVELKSLDYKSNTPPEPPDNSNRHSSVSTLSNTTRARSPQPAAALDDFPDGGYGWVIVAGCSILMFFSIGLTYSWGVIQARLVAENLGPSSTLAFIGSISVSFISFGAILNGRILRLLGARKSAFLACSMLGGGQILSGFTTRSIGGLFVTNGVIVGWGTSMCFMLCGTLPSQYFKRRRGLATGLVYGGAGIGGGVLSVSIDAMIDHIGTAWTFRIMGIITLVATLPAASYLTERQRRPAATIEWSLFRDPKFVLLFFGSGIATFPLLVPAFFLPLYSKSIGISTTIGSALLAVYNVSSALGRVGFGFLCDFVGPITSLALSLILNALSILAIWPVSTSLAPLVIFIIINGLGNGGFFSTVPSVVSHIYGPTRVTTVLAMVLSAWAAGYIMGAPVAGWILERYGGSDSGRIAFRPAMYYAGSLSLGSAGFVIAIRFLVSHKFLSFA